MLPSFAPHFSICNWPPTLAFDWRPWVAERPEPIDMAAYQVRGDRWAPAQVSRLPALARRFFSRVGPAVAEAHGILDFSESFIALDELFAYPSDNCSNVNPMTVFAAPSHEALVVYAVVDRSKPGVR